MIVLDNLSVKQVNESEIVAGNSTVEGANNNTKFSCVINKNIGNCKANFTRYYYSLTSDACVKVL